MLPPLPTLIKPMSAEPAAPRAAEPRRPSPEAPDVSFSDALRQQTGRLRDDAEPARVREKQPPEEKRPDPTDQSETAADTSGTSETVDRPEATECPDATDAEPVATPIRTGPTSVTRLRRNQPRSAGSEAQVSDETAQMFAGGTA